MKALVTGATGFVGQYLIEFLYKSGYKVWGTGRSSYLSEDLNYIHIPLNLDSVEQIKKVLNELKPIYIFHLAGQSSVKESWSKVEGTYHANSTMTLNLLEAIRQSDIKNSVKVLTVGSSEEYGFTKDMIMPITEKCPLTPISPYGLSKASVSLMVKHYSESHGLHVIHARPFNHIGPGQRLGFVTSDFAYQIAKIESNQTEANIMVGNLESQRDFTDVRDIVKVYESLIRLGKSGEVYNICSETPVSMEKILTMMLHISTNKEIKVTKDENRMRPSDIPVYVGDASKIKKLDIVTNTITLEKSLLDIMNYWREKIRVKEGI